uniref:Uncharacterized protein n=1 Tax=Caenorhabditis tropicalis TaxID=1561998 RepID=A0A1I7T1S5_9PELO
MHVDHKSMHKIGYGLQNGEEFYGQDKKGLGKKNKKKKKKQKKKPPDGRKGKKKKKKKKKKDNNYTSVVAKYSVKKNMIE